MARHKERFIYAARASAALSVTRSDCEATPVARLFGPGQRRRDQQSSRISHRDSLIGLERFRSPLRRAKENERAIDIIADTPGHPAESPSVFSVPTTAHNRYFTVRIKK